jgi:hypothetical protein
VENADSEALPESEITFSGSEDSSGTGGDDCSSASEDFDALLARLQARADARRSQIEAWRAELALVSNPCAVESDSRNPRSQTAKTAKTAKKRGTVGAVGNMMSPFTIVERRIESGRESRMCGQTFDQGMCDDDDD